MPFSFTPDVVTNPQTGQPAPQAPFVASSASPIAAAPSSPPVDRLKGEGRSILEILLFAVFGFTALVTVMLFGYKYYLSSQITVKKATLSGYEKRLGALPLEDMRKLSNRLKIVNQLIKDHPSVNVAFLIVEASVENLVTFTKFDLHYAEAVKSYQLTLSGIAPDYKSLAQQLDTYKRKPYSTYVSKVSLENLSLDTSGRVNFIVKMPISIKGLIPETFSIMDGTSSSVMATTSPIIQAVTATTTADIIATTTPVIKVTASTTLPARKP